jgi:hypothetical protein
MLIESDYVKIHVAVPATDQESVRQAMAETGAGEHGNYTHCSGTVVQVGRFTPQEGAEPAIGVAGTPEQVDEVLIMMLCHKDLVDPVVQAVKDAHPYEEPAIDIIPRLDIA